MGSKQLELQEGVPVRVLRQVAEQPEREAGSIPVPQRESTDQVTCRLGDASCAGAHAETLNRAMVQPAPDTLLHLQRQYGNRFVQRVVHLSRQGEGEAGVTPEVEQAIQAARGGGQALDSGVRAQMESAFGADFGSVRVHADSQADSLNRSLSARAFTTGQDIFFKQGDYSPGSSTGRELLAHELTHVVQQNGDRVRRKLTVGAPGDHYEQEAAQLASSVMQREQQLGQQELVRRQADGEEEEPVQARLEDGRLQRQAEEEKKKEEESVRRKVEDDLVMQQHEDEEEKEKKPPV